MPRVSAGSTGPGWGCTCLSSLRKNQYLKAMARASTVTFQYWQTEIDGTLVFHAWSDPDQLPYRVTFNPTKPGKICKHIMACSSYIVGDWLMTGFVYLRKELEECQTVRKELYKLQKVAVTGAKPSDTS